MLPHLLLPTIGSRKTGLLAVPSISMAQPLPADMERPFVSLTVVPAWIVRVALLVTTTLEYTRIVPMSGDQTVLVVSVPPTGVDCASTDKGKTRESRARAVKK